MRLTRISVTAATDSPALLADVIWAAARPGDRLEHVTVRIRHDEKAIGIFIGGRGDPDPEIVVPELLRRACEMSPLLLTWNVTATRHIPIPGLLAGIPCEDDP